jgi:hypothetical protein
LTEERSARIVALIKEGNYANRAAQASGITARTYHRWMEEGEKAEEKCEQWEELVEIWNELDDKQRRRAYHLKPSEEEMPTEQEVAFFQFFRSIKKAEAEAEAMALQNITSAANAGAWQAAAWYLERKHKHWSRNEKVTHEGTVAHQHQHQLLSTSPEAIEAAKERLRAVRALSEGSQAPELPQSEQVIEAEVLSDEDLEDKSINPHNQADPEE